MQMDQFPDDERAEQTFQDLVQSKSKALYSHIMRGIREQNSSVEIVHKYEFGDNTVLICNRIPDYKSIKDFFDANIDQLLAVLGQDNKGLSNEEIKKSKDKMYFKLRSNMEKATFVLWKNNSVSLAVTFDSGEGSIKFPFVIDHVGILTSDLLIDKILKATAYAKQDLVYCTNSEMRRVRIITPDGNDYWADEAAENN